MKCFLVVYAGTRVTRVQECGSGKEARRLLDWYLGHPDEGSATIWYASDQAALDIKVGDSRAADLSDEMDFRGIGSE
jgi:hypothetical protein